MAKDVTKPWKQQFLKVKDVDVGDAPKTIIKPAEHGLLKKGKTNADKHSRTGHRA